MGKDTEITACRVEELGNYTPLPDIAGLPSVVRDEILPNLVQATRYVEEEVPADVKFNDGVCYTESNAGRDYFVRRGDAETLLRRYYTPRPTPQTVTDASVTQPLPTPAGIHRCAVEQLRRYFPLREIPVRDADGTRISGLALTDELIGLLPEAVRKGGGLCYLPLGTEVSYYIRPGVPQEALDQWSVNAIQVDRPPPPVVSVDAIVDQLWRVDASALDVMFADPPPPLTDDDDDNYAQLSTPLTPRMVAQLRAKSNDRGNTLFRADPEVGTNFTYYVIRDPERIRRECERPLNVLASAVKQWSKDAPLDASTRQHLKDRATEVVDVAIGFQNTRAEIKADDHGNEWTVGKIVLTVIVTGVVVFGVGAEIGKDLYHLAKRHVPRLVRRAVRKVLNWFRPKDPPGTGGAVTRPQGPETVAPPPASRPDVQRVAVPDPLSLAGLAAATIVAGRTAGLLEEGVAFLVRRVDPALAILPPNIYGAYDAWYRTFVNEDPEYLRALRRGQWERDVLPL